jgi:hypothetical protein
VTRRPLRPGDVNHAVRSGSGRGDGMWRPKHLEEVCPAMHSLPFYIFWALIWFGRGELGWRGVLAAIGVWVALLVGCIYFGPPASYWFLAAQALLDIVLLLVICGTALTPKRP